CHFRLHDINASRHSFPTRRSSDLPLHPVTKFQQKGESQLNNRIRAITRHISHHDAMLRGVVCVDNVISRSGYADIFQSGQLSEEDRKSTRLNSSHVKISYAVFCLK